MPKKSVVVFLLYADSQIEVFATQKLILRTQFEKIKV